MQQSRGVINILVALLTCPAQTFAHMILKSFQSNFFGTPVHVASLTDVFVLIFKIFGKNSKVE